jgi:ectoine hydrolase
MANPHPRFSREEYGARISKVRAAMERGRIDLLIATDPSNMAWLTGYDGWSFYVHQCVLLAGDGDPVWFGRGIDARGAKRTVFMADDHIEGYPDHYVQSTERHPMDVLAGLIEARGWASGAIGVEMDNYWYTAAAHEALVNHLPNATFKNANALVNWQRVVKSPTEIEYMTAAARIVEAMHARVFEIIEPGMPKNQMAAEILATATRGVDGFGGDYAAIMPMFPSGVDASAPHLTWDERPFNADEGTFFELGGCYRRYHCPLSRTVYLGKPPQAWRDGEAALLDGLEAALVVMRPGRTCEEVEAAWRAAIARHGLEKEDRCGYSIGLSYPPDWGERTLSLRRGDRTELAPDMTIHLMPGLWFDDWGLEITESVRITEGAAERFCGTPRKLFVKD